MGQLVNYHLVENRGQCCDLCGNRRFDDDRWIHYFGIPFKGYTPLILPTNKLGWSDTEAINPSHTRTLISGHHILIPLFMYM